MPTQWGPSGGACVLTAEIDGDGRLCYVKGDGLARRAGQTEDDLLPGNHDGRVVA